MLHPRVQVRAILLIHPSDIIVFPTTQGDVEMRKILRSGYVVTDNAGIEFVVGPGTDFTGADFRGLDLSESDLSGSKFGGADFTLSNLSGSDLSESDFTSSWLGPASFDWAVLISTNFALTDLSGVSMIEAEAAGANFYYAMLEGSDLSGTDFSSCNFSHSQLLRANFRDSISHTANFENATTFAGLLEEAIIETCRETEVMTQQQLETLVMSILERHWHVLENGKDRDDEDFDVERYMGEEDDNGLYGS